MGEYEKTNEIEVTPEMLDAGIRAAWPWPDVPKVAGDIVRRAYVAMEKVRLASLRPQSEGQEPER